MIDPILHHYPQSPVSEKVRVIFGIKEIAWNSVIIPRVPPKPKLMPLTGGFRLTPVLQVGADIYCDSARIALELEKRFPTPSLFAEEPQGAALGFSKWTDGAFFRTIIATVFADELVRMPEEFARDRIALYFNGEATVEGLKAELPNNIAQLRAQFGWLDESLSRTPYFSGRAPGYRDAAVHYLVWFLRGRYADGAEFLSRFTALSEWAAKMEVLGHGTVSELTEDNALEIARSNEPAKADGVDLDDPSGFKPGAHVAIRPDNDANETTGELMTLNRETVSVLRHHEDLGRVAVHFPRVGYIIREA